jgi:transcriptional regulator of heat shock response
MVKKSKKSRKYDILKMLVDEFVETAEPIGSEVLCVKHKLSWSPATIRNDFIELEADGLLAKPHVSGGRVPTNKAYRLIRDELLEEELSVAASRTKSHKGISDGIAMTLDGFGDAAKKLSELTEHLVFGGLLGQNDLVEYGLPLLVREPEFADQEILAGVATFLERMASDTDKMLGKLLKEAIDVYIGEENLYHEIEPCSLIVASFDTDKGKKGFVGILGPTRMRYGRNIEFIKFAAETLGA